MIDKEIKFKCTKDCKKKNTSECYGLDCIEGQLNVLEQLKRKEQECEKLKSQVDEDYNYYTTELKTLRDIISNKEKRNAALFLEAGRYRKALKEIKEYVENDLKITNNTCFDRIPKHILNIINKVKGEESDL